MSIALFAIALQSAALPAGDLPPRWSILADTSGACVPSPVRAHDGTLGCIGLDPSSLPPADQADREDPSSGKSLIYLSQRAACLSRSARCPADLNVSVNRIANVVATALKPPQPMPVATGRRVPIALDDSRR